MEREGLSFRNQRDHPSVGIFCAYPFRNEPESLPHPQDMSVHWENVLPQPEKEKTMNGFWTDPFQPPKGPLHFFGIHFSQASETQRAVFLLDPPEDPLNPCCLHPCQSTRPNGLNNAIDVRMEDMVPTGEPRYQGLVSTIAVPVIRVLREDGSNQGLKRVPLPARRNSIPFLQEMGDSFHRCSESLGGSPIGIIQRR